MVHTELCSLHMNPACHEPEQMVTLVALRPIAEGEEICIRYRRPLWLTPAA